MHETSEVPASTPLSAWIAALAQPTGSPGGGAASGVMLALSAALSRMVAQYTLEESQAAEISTRLVDLRAKALGAAEADGVSSAAFGAALALDVDDPQRDERVREAAIAAARSSVSLGEVGRELLHELRPLAEIAAPQLKADVSVAAEALGAGLAGAWVNLRANLQTAHKHDASHRELVELRADARRLQADRAAAAEIAHASARHFEQ